MTFRAGGRGDSRHEQLQVVIDLGDRADRGAGRLDAIALLDGDSGRNSLDGTSLRLVHPVEELPCVGAEGFDIASLSFGVNGVKGEARFSRATRPSHDNQRSRGEIEINAFEVILGDALEANAWRVGHLGGEESGAAGNGVDYSELPSSAPETAFNSSVRSSTRWRMILPALNFTVAREGIGTSTSG